MKKVSRSKEQAAVAVGIDIGDRWSHWCAIASDGEVAGRGRVRTSGEAILEQAAQWRGVRVAIENGTHSGWMSRALGQSGCDRQAESPSSR